MKEFTIESNFYPVGDKSPKLSIEGVEINETEPSFSDNNIKPLGGGTRLTDRDFNSPNFKAGVAGWILRGDGSFEFNSTAVEPTDSRCRVYINADKTITFGSPQKILFDTESYDNSSEFDPTTNNRFVATNAGTYLINSICQFDPNAADTFYVIYIYKNGTSISRKVEFPNTTAVFSMQITDIVSLAAGDYIEIYVDSGEGSNFTAKGGSAFTFLNIQRVA